jgi:gliotoxin biosynthesis N-methyltransferase
MSTSETDAEANYPAPAGAIETARLHAQHALIVAAFEGRLILPTSFPSDRTGLRILDIGTADGHWLKCVRDEGVLQSPETAEFIGTDISVYESAADSKEQGQVELILHDFRKEFDPSWKESFDLVQMRTVLASVGPQRGIDDADDRKPTELVSKVLALVKPGGFIQIVDGVVLGGELRADDKPSVRFLKLMNKFLAGIGLKADRGRDVKKILEGGGRLHGASVFTDEGVASEHRVTQIGEGGEPSVQAIGWEWLKSLVQLVGEGIVRAELATTDDVNKLKSEVLEEAEAVGFEFPWWAAWARKAE